MFWADEYGDIVGTVLTRGARADWGPGRSFRPAARRSLTDSPLVDPAGDLWFLEAGANRITRVAGVSAGNPAVAPRPDVAVDAAADELGVARARRGDRRSTCGCCAAAREAARADGRRGDRAAPRGSRPGARRTRCAPGDVVAVQPHGADLQAAFATRAAGAAEARQTAGGVAGTARLGARPRGRRGAWPTAGREAAVDAADGSFRLAGERRPTVRWIAATPGAPLGGPRGRGAGRAGRPRRSPRARRAGRRGAGAAAPARRRRADAVRPTAARRRRPRRSPASADVPASTGSTGARPRSSA